MPPEGTKSSLETRALVSKRRRDHIVQHDDSCMCLSGKFKKGQPAPMKGKKMTIKQRAKYQGPKSEAHKKALSEASKRRYADPAERERTKQQQKKRWKDPELLARHSEIVKEQWRRNPNRPFDRDYINPSKLGWKLIDFLADAGFEIVLPEVQIGPYRIDALLAEEWLAFEADEEFHSKHTEADLARDEYLLQHHNLPTVRLSEEDLIDWEGS